MKKIAVLAAFGLALVAAPGIADDRITNAAVKERVALMGVVRTNTAALGGMVQGNAAFDAATAATAQSNLAAAAAQIVALFEAEETDPFSRALPDIWMAFDDYTAKAEALVTAAEALDVASLDTLRAGFGAVGGSCQSCHQAYRGPEK